MEIDIKVVQNGFTIDVRYSGYQGRFTYVAENERSLLDTISLLWREYKNKQAEGRPDGSTI